jgi:hypothetical protein
MAAAQDLPGDAAAPIPFEQRIRHPFVLILVVVALMVWAFGLVDLLSHTSKEAAFFGQYSLPYLALMGVYSLGFVALGALLLRPALLQRLLDALQAIQARWWAALLTLGAGVLLLANAGLLYRFPGVQFSLAVLLVLFLLLLIFYDWRAVATQRWRWLAVGALGLAIAFEASLQGLAATGRMPATFTYADGAFLPYGRVYQAQQGFASDRMNRYGWYYPEFRLAPGEQRIALVGDDYVQALQVAPTQTLGAALDGLIAAPTTEVIALGMPAFGPGQYLETVRHALENYTPSEIVVFVNLGSDFQNEYRPDHQYMAYEHTPEGELALSQWSVTLRHDLAHLLLRSHEYLHILPTLEANYLTPAFLRGLWPQTATAAAAGSTPPPAQDAAWREITPPEARAAVLPHDAERVTWQSAGNYDRNYWHIRVLPHTVRSFYLNPQAPEAQAAVALTAELLAQMRDEAAAAGATLRVVSFPVFEAGFYAADTDARWAPDADGFAPLAAERLLADALAAADIPHLQLGEYLRSLGSSRSQDSSRSLDDAEQIRSLYFADGTGYFTPAGHQFVADAVYRCFYDEAGAEAGAETSMAGCGTTAR